MMNYKEVFKKYDSIIKNVIELLEVKPYDINLEFSIDEHTDFYISQLSNTLEIKTFLMTIPLSDFPTVSHYKGINLTAGLIDFEFDLGGIEMSYVYTVGLDCDFEENYQVYADNLKIILDISEQLRKMHSKNKDDDIDKSFPGVDIEDLKSMINEAFSKNVEDSEESEEATSEDEDLEEDSE